MHINIASSLHTMMGRDTLCVIEGDGHISVDGKLIRVYTHRCA
jgi:hypothetical protein